MTDRETEALKCMEAETDSGLSETQIRRLGINGTLYMKKIRAEEKVEFLSAQLKTAQEEIEELKEAKALTDQRIIDAVAGARKGWAAQGCPEAKGLHGAEVITGLLDSMIGALEAGYVDSNSPTLADLYQTARNHLKDNYGVEIPNIVEKYDQEIAEMCGFNR